AIGFKDLTVYNIVGRLAGEHAVGKIGSEEFIAIGHGAVCGSDLTNRFRPIKTLLRMADCENARRFRIIGKNPPCALPFGWRIVAEKFNRHKVMPEPGRIIVSEPVSPIITMPAKLSLARDQLEVTSIRIKTQIIAAQVSRRRKNSVAAFWQCAAHTRADVGDDATAIAIGGVNPAIQTIIETVNSMLLIALPEARQQRVLRISFPIAIGVFGVKNFRSGAHNHSIAPGHNAVGKIDAFKKHSCLVVATVTVGIFQILDDT